MNSQAIEALRKKLREGRPVRVVNGQVLADGASPASPAQSPAQAQAQTPPSPAQTGVRVKEHEWGVETGTTGPFYSTPRGEQRVLDEQVLLAREYPGFAMDLNEDGTLYLHGWLGPTETLRGSYQVLVVVPPSYGDGSMPLAYVLEPPIRQGAPHLYRDGALCLDHSGAFTGRSTVVTFLAWVSVWLVLYEEWVDTGRLW